MAELFTVGRPRLIPDVTRGHRYLEVKVATSIDNVRTRNAVAGILARVALAILDDLHGNARREHHCEWQPRAWDEPGVEIPEADPGTGCDAYLVESDDPTQPPCLVVRVPPNRERGWIERLHTELDKITTKGATT